MSGGAIEIAQLFSKALQKNKPDGPRRGHLSRQLLQSADPLERLVPHRLMEEALAKHLLHHSLSSKPVILFIDRQGGTEGIKATTSVMEILDKHNSGASIVYVSFNTPPRGLGALLRRNLVTAGVKNGIPTEVVCNNVSAEEFQLRATELDSLVESTSLVISYAASGSAGLIPESNDGIEDQMLSISHMSVLSFPDPESCFANSQSLELIAESEPGMDSIRISLEIQRDTVFEFLGSCLLKKDSNEKPRLWELMDNAKRHRYRIVMEPMAAGNPTDAPVFCPCKTIINRGLVRRAQVDKVVPAGKYLVSVLLGPTALL